RPTVDCRPVPVVTGPPTDGEPEQLAPHGEPLRGDDPGELPVFTWGQSGWEGPIDLPDLLTDEGAAETPAGRHADDAEHPQGAVAQARPRRMEEVHRRRKPTLVVHRTAEYE